MRRLHIDYCVNITGIRSRHLFTIFYVHLFTVELLLFSHLTVANLTDLSHSLTHSLEGGPQSLWRPVCVRHVPVAVCLAGRRDGLSEGGGDRPPAIPDQLRQGPSGGGGS